ncbi:MAG: hypothetical protein FJZ92_11020 [Chloroflexi bacterium]|nr:hypothetical protein [Chloroflexota bacterium]MBM4435283.1 hypothetical protein [Chloroflexota bacterium]
MTTQTRPPTVILDPTDEREPIRRELATRPEHVSGTIGLLDISKPRGNVLLDRLEVRIRERMPNVDVRRYRKPTFAKPAPEDLRQRIAQECSFVIEALAD